MLIELLECIHLLVHFIAQLFTNSQTMDENPEQPAIDSINAQRLDPLGKLKNLIKGTSF